MKVQVDDKLYNDLNSFLKSKFGEKVYKVSVDGGFSCPNLDGKISSEGCIFCNNESNRPTTYKPGLDIEKQLAAGIEYIRNRHKSNKFIAYLQLFSNTYGDIERLKKVYEPLLSHPDIVGLAVSTRPDCIDDEKLDYIKTLSEKKYLWLEFGLQSIFDETLKKINRGHSYSDFLTAYNMATLREIPVCVHIIFGLPGETKGMMLESVKTLSALSPFGLKIHALHILKNTKIHEEYLKGKVNLMDFDAYTNLVADSLELIDKSIVIHRLTGEGPRDLTVAPDWIFNKMAVINAIKDELKRRGSYQGSKLES